MIAGFAAGTSAKGHRETRAIGVTNVDTGEPMTAQSVLHVASLSKPMVAAAFVASAGLAIAVRQGFAAVALADDDEGMPAIEDSLATEVAAAAGLRLPTAI